MPDRWKWIVTAYYGPSAAPPARPGDVADEVTVRTDEERDQQRAELEGRPEIGRVEVARCG